MSHVTFIHGIGNNPRENQLNRRLSSFRFSRKESNVMLLPLNQMPASSYATAPAPADLASVPPAPCVALGLVV
jgi:hypothetical protein